MQALKKQYNLAVLDAKVAEPWEIYRSLIAVVNYGDSMAGQGNLVWSLDSLGKIRVLVVSWMKGTNTQYWPVGTTFKPNMIQELPLPSPGRGLDTPTIGPIRSIRSG